MHTPVIINDLENFDKCVFPASEYEDERKGIMNGRKLAHLSALGVISLDILQK